MHAYRSIVENHNEQQFKKASRLVEIANELEATLGERSADGIFEYGGEDLEVKMEVKGREITFTAMELVANGIISGFISQGPEEVEWTQAPCYDAVISILDTTVTPPRIKMVAGTHEDVQSAIQNYPDF